jgi:hypothetical protein
MEILFELEQYSIIAMPTLSGQSTFAVSLPRIIIGNIDSAIKITVHQGSLHRSIFNTGHVCLATYLVVALPRHRKVKDEINYIS